MLTYVPALLAVAFILAALHAKPTPSRPRDFGPRLSRAERRRRCAERIHRARRAQIEAVRAAKQREHPPIPPRR